MQNQPETHSLDLTNFAKSIFEGNDEYNLLKNPNSEKHFEPIPNSFYGFCIPIPETGWYNDGIPAVDTVDIDFEDITHKRIA